MTRLKILLLIPICALLLALYPNAQSPLLAGSVSSTCQQNNRATGLITSKDLVGIFGNTTGNCAIDATSAFVSYRIPGYQYLKSVYFTQSKANKVLNITVMPSITDQTVYQASGNLTVSANPTGNGTAVIFVDGNLDITTNITYGTNSSGLVFVVGGDINIASAVTTINAVLISEGTIYTANAGCGTSSVSASQLTIKGNLISLDATKPIKFCRVLADNSAPAELVNFQAKYLTILKEILSSTWQKWTEIAGTPFIPSPLPSLSPLPSPSPSPSPSPAGLPPVTNLTATTVSQTSIQISWTGSAGATSYDIYKCNGAGCSPATPVKFGVSSPYTDSGGVCGSTYTYTVIAKNGSVSSTSNPTTVGTTAACP